MWTFSLPKMIRPFFIYHPELRGRLCRAAYETVQEMMAAAAIGCEGFRTGMVAFAATAGDLLNVNPHVHAIAPRGGWDAGGSWVPVGFIDNDAAGSLFRAKVLSFLTGERLLSDERACVLLGWNHNSGFSVDDSVRFEPEDRKSMEQVARYILRPPLSLERLRYSDGNDEVIYRRKGSNGRAGGEERIDALDFLARVIAHIPPPRIHLVRYLGHYSNVSRGRRNKGKEVRLIPGHSGNEVDDDLTDTERRARRRAWARLIRRIYEVDPLVCTNCGGEMRIVSVILEQRWRSEGVGRLIVAGKRPIRSTVVVICSEWGLDSSRMAWMRKRKSLSLRIAQRYTISTWDAMIVHAAASLGAEVLWTEDLNHGQIYEGVPVRNPFRED